MENIFLTIICLINTFNYTTVFDKKVPVKEYTSYVFASHNIDTLHNNNDFKNFLSYFQDFDGENLNKDFFLYNDINGAESIYADFDRFYPYDSTTFNCERKEPYYKPSYKIEKIDFYLISIQSCCDLPFEGFPYEAPTLVTYSKNGGIIDFEIVGKGSDVDSYTIETTEKDNVLKVTQYTFDDSTIQHNAYSGVCEVSEYTITVNDDGSIDKNIIREYTDNVTLPLER